MTANAAQAADNKVVTMPDGRGNLWQRLLGVQSEIDMLAKRGTAPAAMGGFKFVRDIDVFDAVRDLLNKHRVLWNTTERMPPETVEAGQTASGKPIWRTTVHLTLTFRNPDEPDQVETMDWSGQGDDGSDKGMSKAGTSCVKYALLKKFLIGGDAALDPDAHDATGGEGRGTGKPAVDPADDYGPCDQAGCGGRLVAKVMGKEGDKKRGVECSEHGYVRRDGQRKGGRCERPTDWLPDWPWYEAHRDRADTPAATASEAGSMRDIAVRRLQELIQLDREFAASTMRACGLPLGTPPTRWIAGLGDGEALVLVDKLNAAKRARSSRSAEPTPADDGVDPTEIPF